MSKISNVLRMLILLKSRGRMSVRDIAQELEVSERQVKRYKEELEKAHIYIESSRGKYGGYKLCGKDYILGLNITKNEYLSLISAKEQLSYENFPGIDELKSLIEKISILSNKEETNFDTGAGFFIKSHQLNYDFEKEKKIWFDLKAASIACKKVKIKYKSLKGQEKTRIVHPYSIFQYKGSMYFVGFCEYRKCIRQFKLSRIQSYTLLDQPFDKADFDINHYMKNTFGIFMDDQMDIKLKIKYPIAQAVKERIWVEGQKITELISQKAILFEAKVVGITEVKSWILSMGDSVQVLEPPELKNQIVKQARQILKNYN